MRELVEKYSWVSDLDVAWTVSVVEGRSVSEVVGAFGGDSDAPIGRFSFDEAWVPEDDFGKYFHLQILAKSSQVVAIENNGWSGNVPEIARRASQDDGLFFSVYWNVNGLYAITEAVDGHMTAYFELMSGGQPYRPTDLHPSWIEGVDVEPGHKAATCLALMERQAGVAFDRAWLDAKLPTYRIPDPDVMLSDVENARVP